MGKTILVITGPPSSGKPIIARNIAEWFQCPSLYSKGILEALVSPSSDHSPLLTRCFLKSLPHNTATSSSSYNSKHLATTALSVILTQLSYLITTVEPSNGCIILELPLSSPPILDALIQLLLDEDKIYAVDRGVIVECVPKPTTTTTVRARVEPGTVTFPEILYDDGPNSTSKIWATVEIAIQQQLRLLTESLASSAGGGEEQPPRGRVSKLDIDPATDFNPNLATSSLREGRSSSPFHHAVKYLVFDHDLEKHGPLFFSMREWDKIKSKYIPVGSRTKSAPCFKGAAHHDLFYSTTTTQLTGRDLHDDNAKCKLCEEQVITTSDVNSPYYACRNCPLLLHKACAELSSSESGTDRRVEVVLPQTVAVNGEDSISYEDREAHFFPTTHTCEYCTLNRDRFSQNCKSCLFDTHLKNRILPIVYHHPFVPDGLFQLMFGIRRLAPFSEPCAACGRRMHTSILYISRGNALWYGVFCLTQLPLELVEKKHHGCLHPLKLLGKAHEEFDYCICHKCDNERDPERWYYYCEECKYTAHTYCMYP